MGPITSTVPTTASRQNAMKALDAVIIRQEPWVANQPVAGKLRRFGCGSKTVNGMIPARPDEPAGPVGVK